MRTWPLVEFRSLSYIKEKVRQNTLIHLKSAYWLGSGLNLSPPLMSLSSKGGERSPQLCVSSFISGKVSSKDYNSIWPWILPWGRMLDLRRSKKKFFFTWHGRGQGKRPRHPAKTRRRHVYPMDGRLILWLSFAFSKLKRNSFLPWTRPAPGKVIRFCGRHKFQFAFFAQ